MIDRHTDLLHKGFLEILTRKRYQNMTVSNQGFRLAMLGIYKNFKSLECSQFFFVSKTNSKRYQGSTLKVVRSSNPT